MERLSFCYESCHRTCPCALSIDNMFAVSILPRFKNLNRDSPHQMVALESNILIALSFQNLDTLIVQWHTFIYHLSITRFLVMIMASGNFAGQARAV